MQDTESSPPAQLDRLDALRYGLQTLSTENADLQRLPPAQTDLENRVCQQAAELAQANARLQAEIAERAHVEAALRQRETQLQHLTAIGRIISASLDIQEVYQRFVEEMRQLLPFDRIALTSLDASREIATVDYVWGAPVVGRNPGDVYILPGSMAEQAARAGAGKLVLIDDGAPMPPEAQAFEASSLRSHLVHPLIMHDRVIGLLHLGAMQPHAYDEQSLQLVERVSNQIAGAIANAQHYAARKRLEGQLQQAQKMEAIGTLAGGIAHDFNNLLAVVIGYTELLSLDLEAEADTASYMHEILTACRRAKSLVQQILTFSRQGDPERRPLLLHRLVNETLQLLRASLPTTVAFECHIDAQSGSVMADPTQMHQVLMNLCANAEHAMRQHGGVLEVRLEPARIDAAFAAQHPPLRAGPHVRLTVRDTGHGIPPEARDRIFDPFFTTKAVGEGTGMGLSMAHGIITNHDGVILLDSEPDCGATFTIYLPQWTTPAAPEDSQADGETPSGRGHILFIDDEAALTRAAQTMLTRLGYRVTAHTDSYQAYTCFQAAPETFDLVITDQTMPQMTGEMLSQQLRHIRPDIPIILCTGFSHVITKETALHTGINAFLQKPLTMHELGATVQRVMTSQPATSID